MTFTPINSATPIPELSQDNVDRKFRDKYNHVFTLLYLVYTKGRATHFVIRYDNKSDIWSASIKYWKELIR